MHDEATNQKHQSPELLAGMSRYLFLKANEVWYTRNAIMKRSWLNGKYLRFPCVVPELHHVPQVP